MNKEIAAERFHTGTTDCAPPWKRWLALLSVLLLVLVPQAHFVLQHSLPLHVSHAAAQATSPIAYGSNPQLSEDESPCTLCSVLGSATQLASYQSVRPVQQTLKLALAQADTVAPLQWSFDQFSRPPPSSTLGELAAG